MHLQSNENDPLSPCSGICTLNPQGKCIGCFRNVEEIAGWSMYTPAEKVDLLHLTRIRTCIWFDEHNIKF